MDGPNKRQVYLYWDRKVEDAFLGKIWKRLRREHRYFQYLDRYFHDSYRQLRRMTDAIFRKGPEFYLGLSTNQLRREFEVLHLASKIASAGYYIVYDLVNLLTRIVRQEIGEVLIDATDEEQERVYRQLCQVGIRSIFIAERMAFLRRLQQIHRLHRIKRQRRLAAIQNVVFQQWYDFGHSVFNERTNRPFTPADYEQRFLRSRGLSVPRARRLLQTQERQAATTVRKILARFRTYPRVRQHIHWLRVMMGYRNLDSLFIHDYWQHAAPLYDEVSRRLSIEPNDLWWLSREEIIAGLRGDSIRRIVAGRKVKGFTIKQVGQQIQVLSGVRKEDWHEEAIAQAKLLQGSTAFSGKATGRVRSITNPIHEGRYFQNGEILVTSMTSPEFVPLMKRAKAIITDEGGMLCHAAIIARELKKPCVIGTRVATKVLKDGDLVEVDAGKGVVKIL
ncbi:MAG: hypothetical protein HYY50_00125 [Candidatus Kerfeldbacteria bacterium]|nr:hypothetical protein [Candidatus Kerfeldbacteria bacterium]